MLSNKIIAPDCEVILYSWEEPFLHKDLKKIIEILSCYGLFYSLSTNASLCVSFNNEKVSRGQAKTQQKGVNRFVIIQVNR